MATTTSRGIQPIPLPGATYDQALQAATRLILEQRLQRLERAFATGYVITNPPGTPVRTLNVTTATTLQLAEFVATLIADLTAAGRLA